MKRIGITVVVTIIVLAVIGAIFASISRKGLAGLLPARVIADSGSNNTDYSAVFLTNGQVYFGKLYTSPSTEVDLRDIYYLQVNQNLQQPDASGKTPTSTTQPQVSLVKLGSELHGPADEMHINRSQVLFTETLTKDSKVVKAIQTSQNSGTK